MMSEWCRLFHIYLNMKKCILCAPFRILLGHFVYREVMLMEPVKFEIIVDLRHPVSVKQLRTMLGHTSCYKKFIGDMQRSLFQLTRC